MSMRFSSFTARSMLGLTLSGLLASSVTSTARAVEAPLRAANSDVPAVTASRITASVEFSQAAVARLLERDVPKRISTIHERERRCWERRVLGRMMHIDCAYWGHVDRSGPVIIHMREDHISASVPLHGTISAQGIGRLARLLHGTGEASAAIHFDAHPTIRPDWSIGLALHEGYHWTAEPTVDILGFSIGVTRFVEPQMGRILGSVREDLEAKARDLDLHGKMAVAWQHAFEPLKLSDSPVVWIRSAPRAIAVVGFRAHDHVLEAALEITGTTQTFVGIEPPAQLPTSLPSLGQAVTQPGGFAAIVPVLISYDTIGQQFAQAFSSLPNPVDVSVYPSGDKLVVGVRQNGAGDAQSIYLTTAPEVDVGSQTVIFRDLALAEGSPAGQMTRELLQSVGSGVALAYRAPAERIMAAANAQLTRPLGAGFRGEGKLTSVSAAQVRLLSEGLRVDLHASGTLKFVWGP